MSMLDSFFIKGFKASKCKTLLKLTIPRIKLLRNRREIQIKQMRRDIAKLLETGQEATARIRVEHIIREENMMAAQEIIELYCELIAVRLPIIETQRECPLDLKEAISSVCFAAPRCADLPELLQVQILFASKYGKEFVSAATELMPSCGVNRQLIELLSVRTPSPEKKLKLLKEIAEEHELDWDPALSETELLKKHEDLLNGPTQFVTMLPLPKEKHDELLDSTTENADDEQHDSDTNTLDFPEVPTVPLRPSVTAVSAPEISPPVQAALHRDPAHESSNHSLITKDLSKEPHVEQHDVNEENSVATKDEMLNTSVAAREEKQFVPFISPPSLSSSSFSAIPSTLPTSVSRTKSEGKVDLHDVPAAAHGVVEAAECAEILSTSPASVSKTKSEASVDLRDVLAAAQAAAESAERAAAAARSAATLAEARISELTKKSSEKFPESGNDNPFYAETPDEKQHFVHKQSFGDLDGISNYSDSHQLNEGYQESELPDISSFEKLKVEYNSPRGVHTLEQGSAYHQPQRLPSMDDEPYYSYPNLFVPQNSNLGSSAQHVTDRSRSTHDL